MVKSIILVGVGGALGAVARYGVVLGCSALPGLGSLPFATAAVNVLGCFFIGLLACFFGTHPLFQPLILVGFLGSFTTFSTYCYELFTRFDSPLSSSALLWAGIQVILGISAVYAGMKCAAFFT